MGNYKYSAKDKSGQTFNGIIEGSTQAEVENALHKKGLIIVSLKETLFHSKNKGMSKRVPLDDLVVFSRQLATMIDSGITLIAALEILKEQMDNKSLSAIIARIYQDVEGGESFCDSVAKHPRVFSAFFINMIKAGEASGMLDEVLERLALYLEKTASLRRKVVSSLTYPAVIITMAVLITGVLMIKVVPTFKNIFETLGGKLPLATSILISASDMLRSYFVFLLSAFFGAIFVLKRYIGTPRGRYNFDKILLRLPVFGDLFMKVAVAKFSRTFSTLIKSGVPILNALEIVARTSGNKIVEEAVDNSRQAVRQGEPINQPLGRSKVFPPMVVRMIGVGEQAGELEKMVRKIADFYEEQVDAAVNGLTSIIEPLVIAFLGIVIGGIVFALFMPIFKISELIAV